MRDLDYDQNYRHPSPGVDELRIFKKHVDVGAKILGDNGLGGLGEAVRHHHERWDGQGYPDRLAGNAIPFLARIVHAAEVFDVLTSSESYRRQVSRERALAVIKSEAGRQFDPAVVTCALGCGSPLGCRRGKRSATGITTDCGGGASFHSVAVRRHQVCCGRLARGLRASKVTRRHRPEVYE